MASLMAGTGTGARKQRAPAKRSKSPKELPAANTADQAARAKQVDQRLARVMPLPRTDLDHSTPWELLVATILSAQSTDRTINKITPALFQRFPTAAALAAADQEEVEQIVRSSGYFRSKAKAIREASRALTERFHGEVPRSIEQLTSLPGVARKTANVVLAAAYGVAEGIVIDTHAMRVANRLFLTTEDDPGAIEQDLLGLFPRGSWIRIGLSFVLHGRYVCTARAPACAKCPLNEHCPGREAPPEGAWEERAEKERALIEKRGTA